MPCRSIGGRTRASQEAQGTKEKHGQETSLWFSHKGVNEAG